MNAFDSTIINGINQFSQISWTFDFIMKSISTNNLIKGGLLIILFWWGWFTAGEQQKHVHLHLIATLFSCFAAIIAARTLALSLPLRLRPLHNASVDFILPYGMKITALEGWSSFPSDHAVLFYALATGMFYISWKTGVFAFIYTTLFISFPRIYLGLHYPTDIIAGASLGIFIALACNKTAWIKNVSRRAGSWAETRPEFFYPVFFLITYQIVDMFKNSRNFVGALFSLTQKLFS